MDMETFITPSAASLDESESLNLLEIVANGCSSAGNTAKDCTDTMAEALAARSVQSEPLTIIDRFIKNEGGAGVLQAARDAARDLQNDDLFSLAVALREAHYAGGNPAVTAFAALVNQQLKEAETGFLLAVTSMSKNTHGGGTFDLFRPDKPPITSQYPQDNQDYPRPGSSNKGGDGGR
jgi:hypothetical protein